MTTRVLILTGVAIAVVAGVSLTSLIVGLEGEDSCHVRY